MERQNSAFFTTEDTEGHGGKIENKEMKRLHGSTEERRGHGGEENENDYGKNKEKDFRILFEKETLRALIFSRFSPCNL
jgi:hypothetical protein